MQGNDIIAKLQDHQSVDITKKLNSHCFSLRHDTFLCVLMRLNEGDEER